ncbi:MAG: thioesterase II family protein [Roseivirga sp.]
MAEPFLAKPKEAFDDLIGGIRAKRTGSPYIIYGHSMGALMGIDVAASLEKQDDPPLQLMVSGHAGPGTGSIRNWHLMTDDDLVEKLKELGGIPEEIFDNRELLDYFLPILRSDFQLVDAIYQLPPSHTVINAPIIALMGTEEKKSEKIRNWSGYTKKGATTRLLPGGHFFIHNQAKTIAALLNSSFEQSRVW